MTTDKLEQLLKKQAQLKAQIQKEKNKERARERKEDTRRKIIVGGAFLAKAKKSEQLNDWLEDFLNNNLTKDSDRELFKLPPLRGGDERGGGH